MSIIRKIFSRKKPCVHEMGYIRYDILVQPELIESADLRYQSYTTALLARVEIPACKLCRTANDWNKMKLLKVHEAYTEVTCDENSSFFRRGFAVVSRVNDGSHLTPNTYDYHAKLLIEQEPAPLVDRELVEKAMEG